MNIVILTQNYPPEPDTIIHNLSKALVSRGNYVRVLTGFPNYPKGVIYEGYKQKLLQKECMGRVEIVRFPLYPDRSRSFIKRSLNYLSFPGSAGLLGPIASRTADVMIVRHPPVTVGIPGMFIGFTRKIPFVFEIQDMWPETLPATGMITNPFALRLLGKLGMFVYSRAAAITVISPGFKKNLLEKGVSEHKVHVILNSAYEGYYEMATRDDSLAEEFGLKGRFNILYAGNMGPAQGLENVIEAANMLSNIKDLQFVFLGSGIDRKALESSTKAKKLTNVRFLPRQPMERMPSFYALADAVLVHLTNDPLFEITIPGKTQSCLLTGKPVIASVNGDVADLISRAKAGIPVRAMDPKDLAWAAGRLHAMAPEEREAMGRAGRRYYIENMSPEVQADRYTQLFDEIIEKRQRRSLYGENFINREQRVHRNQPGKRTQSQRK
jgi:glycosyltransferase involved in cell wall biosynthesis